jgi:hypothetical protein
VLVRRILGVLVDRHALFLMFVVVLFPTIEVVVVVVVDDIVTIFHVMILFFFFFSVWDVVVVVFVFVTGLIGMGRTSPSSSDGRAHYIGSLRWATSMIERREARRYDGGCVREGAGKKGRRDNWGVRLE